MARDLFLMVMEAEGDLVQPFDDGGSPADASPSPEQAPPTTEPTDATQPDGMDEPPPLSNDDALTMTDADLDGMPDENPDDQNQDDQDNEDGNKNGGEKLSEKANAILNQKLYQQLLDRNKEIEDILDNLQKIVPLLPYETVKKNDPYVTRLKTTLDKGKSYAIGKFVDSKYGENLMFFHKLDAIYNLCEDAINNNLKSLEDDNE